MASSGMHSGRSSSARPSRSTQSSPKPPLQTPSSIDIDAVIHMATTARGNSAPTANKDTRTQLFVGNLPYRVRWQDLKDLFRKAGTVLRADVSLAPDNRSRGYGTVLLATAEDAGRAIDMFNGYSWQTRILEVRVDRMPPEYDINYPLSSQMHPGQSYGLQPSNNYTQFMASAASALLYPPQSMLDSTLDELRASTSMSSFGSSGSLASRLGSSPIPPSPSYPNFMPAGSLILPGHSRTASSMSVHSPLATAHAFGPGALGRSLFVGNLPFHCQWQDLKDLFRRAGPVVRADVAIGPDGRSRGYGTVLFTNEADADNAVNMFNGREYNNRILKVHHDKFTQLPSTTSPPPTAGSNLLQPQPSQAFHMLNLASPGMEASLSSSSLQQHQLLNQQPTPALSPMHIQMPPPVPLSGYQFTSQPASPYDPIPPTLPHALSHSQSYQVPHNAGPLPTALQRSRTAASAPPPTHTVPQQHEMLDSILSPLHQRILRSPPHRPQLGGQKKNSDETSTTTQGSGDSSFIRMDYPSLHHQPPTPHSQNVMDTGAVDSGDRSSPRSATASHAAAITNPATPARTEGSSSPPKATSPQSGGGPHPGPIQLPPSHFSIMSPLTRGGLPPLTPSMPGFTFHPQAMTPPLYPHFLSPGLGPFSPHMTGALPQQHHLHSRQHSQHSPTAFYTANPFLNAAPGGPSHQHHVMGMFAMQTPPLGHPMSPGMAMTPGVPMTPGHFYSYQQHRPIHYPLSPGHPPEPLQGAQQEQHTSTTGGVPSPPRDFSTATAMIAAASNAGLAQQSLAKAAGNLNSGVAGGGAGGSLGTAGEPMEYFPPMPDLPVSTSLKTTSSAPQQRSVSSPFPQHAHPRKSNTAPISGPGEDAASFNDLYAKRSSTYSGEVSEAGTGVTERSSECGTVGTRSTIGTSPDDPDDPHPEQGMGFGSRRLSGEGSVGAHTILAGMAGLGLGERDPHSSRLSMMNLDPQEQRMFLGGPPGSTDAVQKKWAETVAQRWDSTGPLVVVADHPQRSISSSAIDGPAGVISPLSKHHQRPSSASASTVPNLSKGPATVGSNPKAGAASLLPPLELPRVSHQDLESQFLRRGLRMTTPRGGTGSDGGHGDVTSPGGTIRRASFNDTPRRSSGM